MTVFRASALLLLVACRRVSALAGASDLLSAEQYKAQARRAEVERRLMLRNKEPPQELLEPNFAIMKKKVKANKNKKSSSSSSGGGFGGASEKRWSKNKSLSALQKERLLEDGVLRINNAMSPEACADLRAHIVQERETTMNMYAVSLQDPSIHFDPEDYFGIEPGRSCRTDLLLSLQPPSVSRALQELFDVTTGKLRHLYDALVTEKGIMYELAGVVTSPGSERQCVHPDLPFQSTPPLYVTFVALQDVTTTMGPTTFIIGSNTETARLAYEDTRDTNAMDELLSQADIREATLNVGDLVVFDARTMHCGNANLGVPAVSGDAGATKSDRLDRALFNFSFRNPDVVGNLGYKGSMRPIYTKQEIRLGDVLAVVDRAVAKDEAEESSPPFEAYS